MLGTFPTGAGEKLRIITEAERSAASLLLPDELSVIRDPFDPHSSNVKCQTLDADRYRRCGENVGGNVGIHKPVQVVEQESALVRFDSGAAFEPVFQQCQGTGPGENFRKDSPDKRSDMQPSENWARAR